MDFQFRMQVLQPDHRVYYLCHLEQVAQPLCAGVIVFFFFVKGYSLYLLGLLRGLPKSKYLKC